MCINGSAVKGWVRNKCVNICKAVPFNLLKQCIQWNNECHGTILTFSCSIKHLGQNIHTMFWVQWSKTYRKKSTGKKFRLKVKTVCLSVVRWTVSFFYFSTCFSISSFSTLSIYNIYSNKWKEQREPTPIYSFSCQMFGECHDDTGDRVHFPVRSQNHLHWSPRGSHGLPGPALGPADTPEKWGLGSCMSEPPPGALLHASWETLPLRHIEGASTLTRKASLSGGWRSDWTGGKKSERRAGWPYHLTPLAQRFSGGASPF